MTERRYYDAAIQTMPLERLSRLQEERLGRQLDRVWSVPVPFFRRKLERAGLGRADLRGLDDLALVPTTVKAELRASEEEHPPFGDYRGAPLAACVRLGASTGTSGRPTLILWTRKDLEVDQAASARGRDAAARIVGEREAGRLVFDNPLAIVEGRSLKVEQPVSFQSRKQFSF